MKPSESVEPAMSSMSTSALHDATDTAVTPLNPSETTQPLMLRAELRYRPYPYMTKMVQGTISPTTYRCGLVSANSATARPKTGTCGVSGRITRVASTLAARAITSAPSITRARRLPTPRAPAADSSNVITAAPAPSDAGKPGST